MAVAAVAVDHVCVIGSGRRAGYMGRTANQVLLGRRVLGFVSRRIPAIRCRLGLRRVRS